MKMLANTGLCGLLCVSALGAVAQAAPKQNCTDAQKADAKSSAACSATVPKTPPGTAFPGDDADIPVGPGTRADAPAAPLPQSPAAAKTGDAHPFPGEPDASAPLPQAAKGAADAHPYPGEPEASKSGADDGFSSSSSGSSSDPGADSAGDGPLKDAGSSGDDTKSAKGKRRKLPKIDPQTPESRESEDLDVADFYMQTGNAKGAYARAQDAVSIKPDDPFAQFALAEAARKMGNAAEAREHYSKVLQLDPNDKQIRATKLALVQLGPGISR